MKSLIRYSLFTSLLVSMVLFVNAQDAAQASAASYTPVDQGSSVTFKIKNLGFNTDGSFSGLQGRIIFDPNDLQHASFDVSIDAATINTDNSMRDGHLKGETYFDIQNHPRISIVSDKLQALDKKDHYQLTGRLTIKGITQTVIIPFVATPMGNDYIFSGEFSINRKDFNVGGSSTISNKLTVSLTILAKK